MKKIKYILAILVLFVGFQNTNAQNDAKAKSILDNLSKKTASYSAMSASFEYTMSNTDEDINETQNGSLITKGENYHLNIAGQQIICDGKTVWTVLEEAEEVQINTVPEDDEEEDYISPTKILTLWEKGFKYKYDQSSTLDGNTVDIINLYPEEADEKSFHTIRLFVNQAKSIVDQIVIKGKDGTDYTYRIKSFKTNEAVKAVSFSFSNPAYDVIDLR